MLYLGAPGLVTPHCGSSAVKGLKDALRPEQVNRHINEIVYVLMGPLHWPKGRQTLKNSESLATIKVS